MHTHLRYVYMHFLEPTASTSQPSGHQDTVTSLSTKPAQTMAVKPPPASSAPHNTPSSPSHQSKEPLQPKNVERRGKDYSTDRRRYSNHSQGHGRSERGGRGNYRGNQGNEKYYMHGTKLILCLETHTVLVFCLNSSSNGLSKLHNLFTR